MYRVQPADESRYHVQKSFPRNKNILQRPRGRLPWWIAIPQVIVSIVRSIED